MNSEDARETMQFYNVLLQQYQLIVKLPQNPRDAAFNECLNILKETKQQMTSEELAKMASERNEQVEHYFEGIFKMSKSSKIRSVVNMLVNNDCIKLIQQKPVILQWMRETQTTIS